MRNCELHTFSETSRRCDNRTVNVRKSNSESNQLETVANKPSQQNIPKQYRFSYLYFIFLFSSKCHQFTRINIILFKVIFLWLFTSWIQYARLNALHFIRELSCRVTRIPFCGFHSNRVSRIGDTVHTQQALEKESGNTCSISHIIFVSLHLIVLLPASYNVWVNDYETNNKFNERADLVAKRKKFLAVWRIKKFSLPKRDSRESCSVAVDWTKHVRYSSQFKR